MCGAPHSRLRPERTKKVVITLIFIPLPFRIPLVQDSCLLASVLMIINNYSILKGFLSSCWVHSERGLGGENYPQTLMVLVPKVSKSMENSVSCWIMGLDTSAH